MEIVGILCSVAFATGLVSLALTGLLWRVVHRLRNELMLLARRIGTQEREALLLNDRYNSLVQRQSDKRSKP